MGRLVRMLSLGLMVAGCHTSHVPEVTAEAAAALLKSGQARAVDVNTESFRRANGTLPGALLLLSMEPVGLPADKASRLIFYCSNRL